MTSKKTNNVGHALARVIEREKSRDQLRLVAVGNSSPEVMQIVADESQTVIQAYRVLVSSLLSPEMRSLYMSEISMRPRPQRRNQKLWKWVLANAETRTAGEIQKRLDLMDIPDRRRNIGQSKVPGLSTIKRILEPEK